MLDNRPLGRAAMLMALDELRLLYQGFPWESQVWAEQGQRRSPYRALILFGLSARTKDKLLVKMCGSFFERFPAPRSLLKSWPASRKTLQGVVRAGQMPFIESSVQVMTESGQAVPQDPLRLREIKGVGEKIAECVTAYGWGGEALPLDGNGGRVVDRICGVSIDGSGRHTGLLRRSLKEVYQNNRGWMAERSLAMVDIHEMLRLHGQVVCTRVPQCQRCPISLCSSRNRPFQEAGKPVVEAASWQEWRDLLLEPVSGGCGEG
jgi:endonuclease-3